MGGTLEFMLLLTITANSLFVIPGLLRDFLRLQNTDDFPVGLRQLPSGFGDVQARAMLLLDLR